jgi:hypothetical protein
MSLFEEAPSKREWKKTVKEAVNEHWHDVLEETALQKSTLCYINPKPDFTRYHLCIRKLDSIRKSQRVTSKMKLLTGTYTLQTVRLVYKQTTSSLCLLCNQEEETMPHFILDCEALAEKRKPLLDEIKQTIPYVYLHRQVVMENHLVQLILDPTHPRIQELLPLVEHTLEHLEILSQMLLHSLHLKRINMISNV